MSDTFIKWFSRIWLTMMGASMFLWLFRHFPYGLVLLAVGGLAVAGDSLRERRRREKQGWWLDYLGPGRLRDGQDDFAIVYHEGEKEHFFSGKERPRPALNVLTVPSQANWQAHVPDWMSSRRDEILDRIEQEVNRRRMLWRIQVVEERDD